MFDLVGIDVFIQHRHVQGYMTQKRLIMKARSKSGYFQINYFYRPLNLFPESGFLFNK